MDPNETETIPDDVLNPGATTELEQEPSLDEALAESLDRAIEEGAPADVQAEKPAAPEGDAAASEKPSEGAQPETPTPKASHEQDAEAEAEISALGLKQKAAERFRELTAELKALAPLRERAAEFEARGQQAERAQQWEETVQSTGATPEQMGNALGYLAAVNSRDPAAMAQAYDFMQQEMAWLAKELGRSAPGYDPVADHADLAKRVEAGELSRSVAEELAQSRRMQAMQQDNQQRQRQSSEQAAAVQQVEQQAMEQVQSLGVQLRTADPQHFDAKLKAIQPMMQMIQASLPPQQWAAAIQQAYMAAPTPATPVAVAPAAPAPSAVRPGGPRGGMSPQRFDSVEDALDFAIDGPPSR